MMLAVCFAVVGTVTAFAPPVLRPSKAAAAVGGGLTTTSTTSTTLSSTASLDSHEKTLYQVLGASPHASQSQLRNCYRARAKCLHPDANIISNNNEQCCKTVITDQ